MADYPTTDYSDEDREGYVPWWDRTPTGSSSDDDDGDSSDEAETEAYSYEEEEFFDYEYEYEEAKERYLNAPFKFFDDELYD